jgi:nucleoside-diphosphate-sugar epimerase
MRVFVAGATGAIGRPLVRQLVAAGHEVVGTTRSEQKAEELRAAGATPAVRDALEAGPFASAALAAAAMAGARLPDVDQFGARVQTSSRA